MTYWTRTIEKLVHAACVELNIKPLGTHAFRAGAAQCQYDTLRERGCSDREARKEVSRMLGHNRLSVTNSLIKGDNAAKNTDRIC